ncbi:uncharacterized protein LOC116291918 [Actinia tenebrosa]|uniref:Uncharacterized protein LOC116291918 n=1 Tax=Actinia tenebrosa TaxID=6105 RepID=A0A6P8HJH0_ACTTE|nr:uncharacterized protein LOC116291918 [Actinia tenebrosa]
MPDSCSVYGCSNRSNKQKEKRFFRIPKEVVHKGERTRDLSKRRRSRWLANLSLSSKGVESPHARVCSDHFVKGCPSNIKDEDDIDWAPTLKLGHQKIKQATESSIKRGERSTNRDLKRRHSEAASALLDLQKQARLTEEISYEQTTDDPDLSAQDTQTETTESPNRRDAECQTDFTSDL